MPPQKAQPAPDFIPAGPEWVHTGISAEARPAPTGKQGTSAPPNGGQVTGSDADFIPADPNYRAPEEQPQGNKLQRAFDELTTVTPEQDAATPAILKPFAHFGAGAIQGAGTPFVHPLQTIEGIGNTIAHPLDTAQSVWAQAKEDPAKAAGGLVGGAVMGEGAGEVGGALSRALSGTTERGGLNLGNAALGARGPKPFKYGANPARGAFDEGVLPAWGKHSASMALEKALPEVGQRISDKVMAGGSVPAADIARSIDAPITETGNVMSGFGGGKPLDPVTNLWASMEEKAPNAATPIYGKGAPADVSAPDLWNSIRNLDKNTRFNPDPEVEGVNELRRDIRGGLRGNLEDAAPGLKPLSRRYGDLKSAEDVLERTMHGGTNLRRIVSIPTFPVESTVGRAMYGAGKAMANPPLPRVFENTGPAMGLVQALRTEKKKEQ